MFDSTGPFRNENGKSHVDFCRNEPPGVVILGGMESVFILMRQNRVELDDVAVSTDFVFSRNEKRE